MYHLDQSINACLADLDPELYQAVGSETTRQEQHLELIASENYAHPGILALQGSILTNKYAEGYPGKRYYGGCEFVDIAENLAITRAKQLFNASYVNVQPHSGSQANAAVMLALLQPGDTILGMGLNDGGHLTHGSKVSFSGKIYRSISYQVSPTTEQLDYDQIAALAKEHQPKLIVAGFSAYSRVVDWQKFRAIADSVNAYLLADIAHVAGLIATNLYPSPLPFADVVTTTTHKTLRGPRGGLIMAKENPEITKKLNAAVFPGSQGGPLMHVIAAKALAFKLALAPDFTQYCQQVVANAKKMAEILIARDFHILTNGTDNHMLVISLINKNINGKAASDLLGQANITVNHNSIPNDPLPPRLTSGIRIGTPAITTRGFNLPQAELVANWIADILNNHQIAKIADIQQQVLKLCKDFPVYSM